MIKPLGSDKLMPLYVADDAKRAELLKEAEGLPSIVISSAAAGNAVMLAGGYFTPLTGYMNVADSMSVAKTMKTTGGQFWPTPVLNVVEDASATTEMKQQFAKSMLMVLGKNIAVKENHKSVLKESLSWSVYNMQADSVKPFYKSEPNIAAASIGLGSEGFDKIMSDLLPSSLVKVKNSSLSDESKKALPEIMKLYLIHNQSFLTDFKFLGFPFHYWYTAQFLLILFVLLCLYYAVSIDRMNREYDFVEET